MKFVLFALALILFEIAVISAIWSSIGSAIVPFAIAIIAYAIWISTLRIEPYGYRENEKAAKNLINRRSPTGCLGPSCERKCMHTKNITVLYIVLPCIVWIGCREYNAPASSLTIDVVFPEKAIADSCQLIVPFVRIAGTEQKVVPQRTVEDQKVMCTWAINDLSNWIGSNLELRFHASCTDTPVYNSDYHIEEHMFYGYRVYLGSSREFWPEQNVNVVRPGCWDNPDSIYIDVSKWSTLRY